MTPNFDFETFSECKLKQCGAWVYSLHPSTEALCVSYNLGHGVKLWQPRLPVPVDLIQYIASGGIIEAHYSAFEYAIWTNVCAARMGWPGIRLEQMRCSMAKAQAWGLPGALKNACIATGAPLKDEAGAVAMRAITKPRKPSKKNPVTRWTYETAPEKFEATYKYCVTDSIAESGLSERTPDLSPFELQVFQFDQRCNARGVYVDIGTVNAAISIIEQAERKYNPELAAITGHVVTRATEATALQRWLAGHGVYMDSMDADAVADALKSDTLAPGPRRALEIRGMLSSSSIKKVYKLRDMRDDTGRIHGIAQYHGAERTGRWAGRGVQMQNAPKGKTKILVCQKCNTHHWAELTACPRCLSIDRKPGEWGIHAMESAILDLRIGRLDVMELLWGNALEALSGCLRGMITAAPGNELICSDYSAIEAVVSAEIAGEEWRLEVFRTHGKIYESSAAEFSGTPFTKILAHKKATGHHHPLRAQGKIAELASGFGGWINAWKNFGADEFMTDDDIKAAINAWRLASPNIVEMWGGQWRKAAHAWDWWPERFGLEGAAINAIENPGQWFGHRDIWYIVQNDILSCRLPSDRYLTYHKPRLVPSQHPAGRRDNSMPQWEIIFHGPTQPAKKWGEISTYGGKLFENVVQAIARDILAFGMLSLDAAGYPIVLHVHDENVAEVLEGTGDMGEFERIMSIMPDWATGWPIKAIGGWRGKRFRKD